MDFGRLHLEAITLKSDIVNGLVPPDEAAIRYSDIYNASGEYLPAVIAEFVELLGDNLATPHKPGDPPVVFFWHRTPENSTVPKQKDCMVFDGSKTTWRDVFLGPIDKTTREIFSYAKDVALETSNYDMGTPTYMSMGFIRGRTVGWKSVKLLLAAIYAVNGSACVLYSDLNIDTGCHAFWELANPANNKGQRGPINTMVSSWICRVALTGDPVEFCESVKTKYAFTSAYLDETDNMAMLVCNHKIITNLSSIAASTYLQPQAAEADIFSSVYRNPDEEDED